MAVKRGFGPVGPFEGLWLWLEKIIGDAEAASYNPLNYLGAICIFFMWIILVTGFYLFIFYSISAREAWPSVESITHTQWYLGGVMRSLHRYASDGLIIAMTLHTLHSLAHGRYKHWRKIAWVSGVVIAWVVVLAGIFGYWMVWDEKAKLVALLASRMFEALPVLGLPLSLNFARIENLTNNLFYIILFTHFSTSVLLFFLIMVHISRITKAVINPPKAVSYGIIGALLIISFVKPALSAPQADLKTLPQTVPFDWFYLFPFPILKFLSARVAWVFWAGVTAVFAIVPWLTWGRGAKRGPAAEVTLENCVGCELCKEDCPYQAIQMKKRSDTASYELAAVVLPGRCASCGICAGACDYNAINLPDMTETSVKGDVRAYSKELSQGAELGAGKTVLAFMCAKGVRLDKEFQGGRITGFDNVRAVYVPCIGMLQPSMLALPFEEGVDGVFVAACAPGDCHYRAGNDWFSGRLSGVRPPVVKKSMDRSRLTVVYLSAVEKAEFKRGLSEFISKLRVM